MQTIIEAAQPTYRRDLGDGLVLRWSTADDIASLLQLVGHAFRRGENAPPNANTMNMVSRLMRGDSPLMGQGDYGLIEDTSRDGKPFVACTCLWRQRWEYDGIPFEIGRPEFVGTDPAYRNRGLIRALFEMIHARSEAEGHLVQAITGIPYFYRQFGYEYAIQLDAGRTTYISQIAKLKEGESEPYLLRDALVEDIPFIMRCYNRRRAQSLIWTDVPEYYWQYEIEGWKKDTPPEKRAPLQIITTRDGVAQGIAYIGYRRWGSAFEIFLLEWAPGANLQAMMPSLLRAFAEKGRQVPVTRPDVEAMTALRFFMESNHPIYEVLGDTLAPYIEIPYAWYVRVADLPRFIRHIAPALEQRLVNSAAENYTGELKLNFYRSGLRIVFDKGKLTLAEPYTEPIFGESEAGFPPLVFLQLLFGHRSLSELRFAFPDVTATPQATTILNILFPKRVSMALPL